MATDGRTPVSDWLRQLRDLKARSKILVRIKRIELGNLGVHRGVGDGVMEFIINTGPGYRLYFALPARDRILLLSGGSKRTQSKDIGLAKRRLTDFKTRRVSSDLDP